MAEMSQANEVSNNNKRIARNTVYLYLRMILVMAVGFYTSRVVLKTLGVSDYGVFNVVGGVIGVLGYVNTLLAGGTSRFLTIALGENNYPKLKLTFSTMFVLTMLVALLVIALGETVGLWFVNNYLNIDRDRMDAVNWVYQCALLSSALTIAQSPFAASIISHEKMNVYAYVSIFDVIMKLVIVYMLIIINYDKLKVYAVLLFVVNFLDIVIYRIYCIKQFKECELSFKFDRQIFKEQLSFSGWNMLGSLSAVCINYGINIVINIFFGTIVNAARGVATQVSNIVQNLYSNFQLAGRPQVMKYYANKQYPEMFQLMCNNGKYCALLLICIIIPVFIYTEELLGIWLTVVPTYTTGFVRWALLYTLFRSFDEPLSVAIHAVGRMKIPNMTCAVLNMMILPIAYIIYRQGGSPLWGAILLAVFVPLCSIMNFWILKKYINFPWQMYVRSVFFSVGIIIAIGLILPISLRYFVPQNTWSTLISAVLSGFYVMIVVFVIGLSKQKRKMIIQSVLAKLGLKHKKA